MYTKVNQWTKWINNKVFFIKMKDFFASVCVSWKSSVCLFVQQPPETQILTLNLLGASKLALVLAPVQSRGWQKAVSCTLSQDIGGFSRIVLGLCDDSARSESSSWRRGKAWQGWKPCRTRTSDRFNTAKTGKRKTTSLCVYGSMCDKPDLTLQEDSIWPSYNIKIYVLGYNSLINKRDNL